MLAKLTDIQSWPGLSGTDDAFMTLLIEAASALFADVCDRTLEKTAVTADLHDGGARDIHVRAYPIVSVAAVKEAVDYAFDDATALTADDDYYVHVGGDRISRIGTTWLAGRDTVQVSYTGGYVDPADTPGENERAVPADLQHACGEQVRFWYLRCNDIGLTTVSHGQDQITQITKAPLLPSVRAVLDRYRRRRV